MPTSNRQRKEILLYLTVIVADLSRFSAQQASSDQTGASRDRRICCMLGANPVCAAFESTEVVQHEKAGGLRKDHIPNLLTCAGIC